MPQVFKLGPRGYLGAFESGAEVGSSRDLLLFWVLMSDWYLGTLSSF